MHEILNVQKLYGVDVKNETITAHPLFPNPKQTLRPDIVASLVLSDDSELWPAIDVYETEEGEMVILDGYHRVTAAIRRYNEENDIRLLNIPVNRVDAGSDDNAVLYAARANLAAGRDNLTEIEEVCLVERLLSEGFDVDVILENVGLGNIRWIRKIKRVIEATPEVLEAVKRGEISLETADKIVKQVDEDEQEEAVEEAVKETKEVGEVKARQRLGLRKAKEPMLRRGQVMNLLFEIWPEVKEQNENPNVKEDKFVIGQWQTFSEILCMDDWSWPDITSYMEEKYDEFKIKKGME